MKNQVLPWQTAHWQRLYQRLQSQTMPHALLFSGALGMGKRQFVALLSQTLLCESPTASGACGVCHGCKTYHAGVHPDYHMVDFEGDSRVIKISQVRKLIDFMALTAQFGGYQVAVIQHAEYMNAAAANSLLKTLEEPGRNSILILLAEQPALLSATIRSRCQLWGFAPPPNDQALTWLKTQTLQHDPALLLALANGAPMQAVALNQQSSITWRAELLKDLVLLSNQHENLVKIASKWHSQGVVECLQWLSGMIMDMIRYRLTGNITTHIDLQSKLIALSQHQDIIGLYRYLDKIRHAANLLHTTVNTELLLEDVFIAWQRGV